MLAALIIAATPAALGVLRNASFTPETPVRIPDRSSPTSQLLQPPDSEVDDRTTGRKIAIPAARSADRRTMRGMTEQRTVRDRPPEGAGAPSWVQVSYGAPPRDQRPERTGKVLGWVSVAALVALVAVAIGGIFAAQDLAEKQAVHDAVDHQPAPRPVRHHPRTWRTTCSTENPAEQRAAVDSAGRRGRRLRRTRPGSCGSRSGPPTDASSTPTSRRLIGDRPSRSARRSGRCWPRSKSRADISDLTEEENKFETGLGSRTSCSRSTGRSRRRTAPRCSSRPIATTTSSTSGPASCGRASAG